MNNWNLIPIYLKNWL